MPLCALSPRLTFLSYGLFTCLDSITFGLHLFLVMGKISLKESRTLIPVEILKKITSQKNPVRLLILLSSIFGVLFTCRAALSFMLYSKGEVFFVRNGITFVLCFL